MKYLLFISAITLTVSAYGETQSKPTIEQAFKECQAVVDEKKDRVAFDACMKAKGFERPKDKSKS